MTPVPDTLFEYACCLLRGTKNRSGEMRLEMILKCSASAEISRKAYRGREMAPEGPYGDHTGYYNEVDQFPVFTVTHITQREDAIYHSTYTAVR